MSISIATQAMSTVGGAVITPLQTFATVNGSPIITVGSPVATHASNPPHAGAVTAGSSSIVRVNGVLINRVGDIASCGDPIVGGAFATAD